MTGCAGPLGSAEIVARVVLARQIRPAKKGVLMGVGETAHNLDAKMQAIGLLGAAEACTPGSTLRRSG